MEEECNQRQQRAQENQLQADAAGLDVDELGQEHHEEQQCLGIQEAVEGASAEDFPQRSRLELAILSRCRRSQCLPGKPQQITGPGQT
ncbi:hypothetical protein D3C84_912970 [compost metagenome]